MRTFLIVVLILAVLGGGGYYFWQHNLRSANAAATTQPTAKVEKKALRLSVASTGRIVSNLDVDIKCKASGPVIKLTKDVSDPVKAGELLCELDPIDSQRVVDQAKASLASSQAKLAAAKQTYQVAVENLATARQKAEANVLSAQAKASDTTAKAARTRELFEKKISSKEEVETAETAAAEAAADLQLAKAALAELKQQEMGLEVKQQDIAAAAAQVAMDKTKLDDAEQRFKDTKIFAPIDGWVAARNVQIGSMIASGVTNVSGGTTVMTLSDLSRMWVYATVDESDIGKVIEGQRLANEHGGNLRVDITADAFPGKTFGGEVQRISKKGVNSSNVVTFEVRIEVTSPNKDLLRPEMTANVEIVTAEKPDVLAIPVQAFVRSKKGPHAAAAGATTSATTGEAATQEAAPKPKAPRADRGDRGGKRPGAGLDVDARPQHGTVVVVKADGAKDSREVTVGMTDGVSYEVLSGLEEGETVVLNKIEAESRWRGGGRPMGMMGH